MIFPFRFELPEVILDGVCTFCYDFRCGGISIGLSSQSNIFRLFRFRILCDIALISFLFLPECQDLFPNWSVCNELSLYTGSGISVRRLLIKSSVVRLLSCVMGSGSVVSWVSNKCLLSKICGSSAAWGVFQAHDIKRFLRRDRCENHKNFS